MTRALPWLEALAPALLVLALGAAADAYGQRVLTLAGLYALAVLGYQFVFGHAGALSLAQGTFFGLGAYVTGILATRLGWPFPASFAAAVAVPVVLAAVIATPVARLQTHYFALATLGIGQVVLLGAVNWESLTGGANGLAGIPPVTLAGMPVTGLGLLALVWVAVAAGGALSHRLTGGRHGLAARAMRRNDASARALGIATARLRFAALVLSAAYGGAAGALHAHLIGVISPAVLGFSVMVAVLTMTVVGGRFAVSGAVIGALLLTVLPEMFRFLEEYYLVAYGVALLVTVVLAPDGLAGLFDRWRRPSPASGPSLPLPAPPPATLAATGLYRHFGGVQALADVAISMGPGEIVGIIGPNGSGKSTLVNVLAGDIRPDAGRVTWNGADITGRPPHRRAVAGLARSFQTADLDPGLSVLDTVATARWAFDRDLADARAHARGVLTDLGLDDVAGQPVGGLPHGRRRQVVLARALALGPAVLLLDEPAAGLAPDERQALAARLADLRARGLAIAVVEHDMAFLLPLADRVLCLDQGRMVAEGPPDRLGEDLAVRRAYFGGRT